MSTMYVVVIINLHSNHCYVDQPEHNTLASYNRFSFLSYDHVHVRPTTFSLIRDYHDISHLTSTSIFVNNVVFIFTDWPRT